MATKKKKAKITLKTLIQESNPTLPLVLLLANKILNIIGFVDFIDRMVEWDQRHWNVSPGNLAKAVILVTFLKIRVPLFKIEKTFVGIDTEALFGKGVMPKHLNDDAIARALDRISQAKPEGLFTTLCLSLYSKFNIAFNRLHSDTTTISFYGAYEQSDQEDEEDLRILRGYNKDGRPECKQVVVGKIVNEHGIAIASSNMNGNTSDTEWNEKAIKLVKETFGERLNSITYIADSKLINLPLFKQMMEPGKRIRFISRCPSNFYSKIEGKVITQAYQDNNWIAVGKIGLGKNACTYKVQEYLRTIDENSVRLIVVKSSAGQERYKHKLQKQQDELEKDIEALSKKTFVCEADAQMEWKRFEKAHKKNLYQISVRFNEIRTEKKAVGNPGKNPKPPQIKVTWQVCCQIIGIDEVRAEKFRHEEECFVLITSVEKSELDSEQVLRQYKDQSIVETQFKLLKEPAIASAIFLKTPGRIDALMMLLNVSLLIRALIQYKVRKSISESQEEAPKIGWHNNKIEKPTINLIIDSLQHTSIEKVAENAYTCSFHNDIEQYRVITILDLLGISIDSLLDS
jgi:transposase